MLHVCQFMLCMDCESEIKIYYYIIIIIPSRLSINVSLLSRETFYSAKKNQVQRQNCQYLTLKYVNSSNWPPFWEQNVYTISKLYGT